MLILWYLNLISHEKQTRTQLNHHTVENPKTLPLFEETMITKNGKFLGEGSNWKDCFTEVEFSM